MLGDENYFPSRGEKDGLLSAVRTMNEFHKAQLALCNRLESLADSLPQSFDAQEALHVARQIVPTVKQAHAFEEKVIFDTLRTTEAGQFSNPQSLNRLKFEHWEDEALAEDLAESLIAYAAHPSAEMVGKLSYMLRGFFDNLRRHIAFEAEFILPVLAEPPRKPAASH